MHDAIAVGADEDHSSISKPPDRNSEVYLGVKRFIADLLPANASVSTAREPETAHTLTVVNIRTAPNTARPAAKPHGNRVFRGSHSEVVLEIARQVFPDSDQPYPDGSYHIDATRSVFFLLSR